MADAAAVLLGEVAKHHEHLPEVHEHISHFGQNVLWVTFISFAITFVLFAFKTFQLKPAERANAYTSLFIVGIAGFAYYSMATGLGVAELRSGDAPHHWRQLFYARYIDWVFTTPLLLLELVLLSGLDLGSSIWIVGSDVAMIATGLFGALEAGVFKWGWFFAGCVFMIFVMVGLWKGRDVAFRRNSELGQLYSGLTIYLLALWWAYPIVWAFSEGNGKLGSDKEVLLYAILDVLAKIVFASVIYIKHPIVAAANTAVVSRLDAPLLGASGEEAL